MNTLDLSPNYAGALMGITNGIGALAGIAAVSFKIIKKNFFEARYIFQPYIVGILTPNRTLMEWRVVFYVILAVLTFSNIFYLIFASGNIQKWNDPRKRATEADKK